MSISNPESVASSLTLRAADARSCEYYPLPCQPISRADFAEAAPKHQWHLQPAHEVKAAAPLLKSFKQGADEFASLWLARIRLPTLTAGDIIVPSFSALGLPAYSFAFALHLPTQQEHTVPLPWVPSAARGLDSANTEPLHKPADKFGIATHVDYFTIEASQQAELWMLLVAPEFPLRFMLAVSIRALQLSPEQHNPPANLTLLSSPNNTPCLSQKLGPEPIRGAICSPTAMAMALGQLGSQVDWLALVDGCRDPATGMFGVWPLNIQAASALGHLGAVEAFSRWRDVVDVLSAGLPIVASIRYKQGELTNAAQPQTGGHLVLLHGIDGDHALVHDPAGQTLSEVPRRYPLAEFAAAWLSHRGAGYVLLARTPQAAVDAPLQVSPQVGATWL